MPTCTKTYRYQYVAVTHRPVAVYSEDYPEQCHCSGEPAKDLISLLTLCATLNDSATADVSSSPSPQVAVIIARCANFWGSPASDAAFSQRIKMLAESTAFRPGLVGTIP